MLHELLVALPHEDFVYLGDTARFPYGERSAEELERFSLEIGDRLVEERAKLLVVACNSATAAALPALQAHVAERTLPIDVVGVVSPESVLAVAATRNGRIGLLATPATVASRAYDRAINSADPLVRLVSVPCPDLAPIIQGGFPFDQRVVDTVRSYCTPLREAERRHRDPRAAPTTRSSRRCSSARWVATSTLDALGSGRRAAGRARARRPRPREPRATARATTASCARATWRPSARSARGSCSCRWAT